MSKIKVACIQIDISQCAKERNIEKVFQMANKVISSGAKLIVLPEVFSTGFCYENIDYVAENSAFQRIENYPTIEKLAKFSKENDCILVGSIIEKQAKNNNHAKYHNLGFCIESGNIAGTYRKTHLYGKEKSYFTRGNGIHPIKLNKSGITIGLEICYDLRFPEVARKLTLEGADILVTIAEFARPKANQWKVLSSSRAIENQIPHISCNCTGNKPYASYFGNSLIVDAWGNVKVEAGEDECFIMHEIDMDETKKIRSKVPIFEDRQLDLY